MQGNGRSASKWCTESKIFKCLLLFLFSFKLLIISFCDKQMSFRDPQRPTILCACHCCTLARFSILLFPSWIFFFNIYTRIPSPLSPPFVSSRHFSKLIQRPMQAHDNSDFNESRTKWYKRIKQTISTQLKCVYVRTRVRVCVFFSTFFFSWFPTGSRKFP